MLTVTSARLAKVFVMSLAALVLTLPNAGQSQAKEIQLKLVTAFPFNGPAGIKVEIPKLFIKEFNKRAKGKAKIVIVGGPEVVSPFDQLKALQDRQFDMMVTTSLYFKALRPMQFYHYIPYDRQVAAMKTGYKLMQEISRKEAGVVFLFIGFQGQSFRIWTTKKPIRVAGDLKGMKIRTFGDTTKPLAQHLRIAPVSIPSNEVYTALRSGLLDGALRESLSLDVLKESDFLKYGIQASVADINGEVFISARTWDGLPADVKKIMNDTSRWVEPVGYKLMKNIVSKNLSKLKAKQGVKLVPSDPGLVKALAGVRRDIIAKVLAGSPWKDRIVKEFNLQDQM